MVSSGRVLVVDDEVVLADIIASYFKREGFETETSYDGLAAVETAKAMRPDLIVLDLMLPGLDGIEVCKEIRKFSDAYIIMLTARDEEIDKIVGLAVGADDYMVKPFSTKELIARARAMLRRPRTDVAEQKNETLTIGELSIDLDTRVVLLSETPIDLTRTEFDILAALARRPKVAFSRRQIIDAVWGDGWYGDEHVVDVHVGHLRKKLGDDLAEPVYLRTVRGVGYAVGSS
ncbi:transcriptional regulatory protein YycF [mine drainage metagenome]|uniref:Transcriptional regulatory protein YycF n=1 Tax=mine drainage metagenome TaxID=410659 RepID=A0A1J5Q1V3_9ZZZZ